MITPRPDQHGQGQKFGSSEELERDQDSGQYPIRQRATLVLHQQVVDDQCGERREEPQNQEEVPQAQVVEHERGESPHQAGDHLAGDETGDLAGEQVHAPGREGRCQGDGDVERRHGPEQDSDGRDDQAREERRGVGEGVDPTPARVQRVGVERIVAVDDCLRQPRQPPHLQGGITAWTGHRGSGIAGDPDLPPQDHRQGEKSDEHRSVKAHGRPR